MILKFYQPKLWMLVLLTTLFSLSTYSQKNLNFTKKDGKEINKFFEKGIRRNVDEHEDIIWFKSKSVEVLKEDSLFGSPSTEMEIYFGIYKEGDKIVMTPLRIKNYFYSNNWIFFNKISIIYRTLKEKKQGIKEKFELFDDDVKRNTSGGRVSEISDVVVSDEILDFLKKICSEPKSLRIRYSGDDKYYEGYTGVFLKRFNKKLSPLLNTYLNLQKHLSSKQ